MHAWRLRCPQLISARRGESHVARLSFPWCPLDVLRPEIALVVPEIAHVLVPVREALQDPLREVLVHDNLPLFMESIPRPIAYNQMSGPFPGYVLELRNTCCFVAGYAMGVGNPITLVYEHYPRCSSVAGSIVDRCSLELLDHLLGYVMCCEEEDEV